MTSIDFIGLIAAVLTTSAFIPQVYTTWKTHDVKNISLSSYCILLLGVGLWLGYGLEISSAPLILANSITMVCTFALIVMKLRY